MPWHATPPLPQSLTPDATVFEKRKANAKKGYIALPNGEVAPASALAGRRVIGAQVDTEKPSSGMGNSMLFKLFSRVEKGGPAAEGRVDTMANMGSVNASARRASRLVQPGDLGAPAPAPATATSLRQQREQALGGSRVGSWQSGGSRQASPQVGQQPWQRDEPRESEAASPSPSQSQSPSPSLSSSSWQQQQEKQPRGVRSWHQSPREPQQAWQQQELPRAQSWQKASDTAPPARRSSQQGDFSLFPAQVGAGAGAEQRWQKEPGEQVGTHWREE